MGIWDFLKGELLQVLEWTDDSRDTLVYRFPVQDHAIKVGAQLTVREGQVAVFVNEGKLADVFEPGRYKLETANLPILTRLMAWPHGFNSPFKAEVYFISTAQFTDQKWGTANPIPMRDPEIGAVRIRAFGTYTFRVGDAASFLREVFGTDTRFTVDEISQQLRSHVVSSFAETLGEAGLPVFDLAANYSELGETIGSSMAADFGKYGLELVSFIIENVSLPPEVEEMLDKRASMKLVGDMDNYARFQAANAMEAAASNPGGGASDGLALGAGLAMGQAMAAAMGTGSGSDAAVPGASSGGSGVAERLQKLKELLDQGLISDEDYEQKKAEVLTEL